MKSNFLYVTLAIINLVCLVGCLQTRSSMEEKQEKQVLQGQLQNLQRNKADMESRFQEVEGQFRQFNGRVEQLEAKHNNAEKGQKEKDDLLQQRFVQVEERMKAYEEELVKLREQVASNQTKLDEFKATPKKQANEGGEVSKGSFTQGEELFEKKEWKSAVLAYQKYREKYPNGKNYAEATYKIGVCFEEMGMKSEARLFYQEAVDKFPKSKEAKKSKYRISNLK